MNIVEAYIKFKSQLIILISGLSGSGITSLGKNISRDFKLKLISYKDYIKPDVPKTTIKYNDKDIDFVNMDTDEAIDWDKFLFEIKNNKQNGIVAIAPCFFINKTKQYFSEDMHINVKLTKFNIVKRRAEYDMQNQNEKEKEKENNTQLINMIVNNYAFPFYLKSTSEEAKITKFINANEYVDLPKQEYDAKVYDAAFDYLINTIQRWLDNYTKATSDPDDNIQQRKNKFKTQEKKESQEISTSPVSPLSMTDDTTIESLEDDTTYLLH